MIEITVKKSYVDNQYSNLEEYFWYEYQLKSNVSLKEIQTENGFGKVKYIWKTQTKTVVCVGKIISNPHPTYKIVFTDENIQELFGVSSEKFNEMKKWSMNGFE